MVWRHSQIRAHIRVFFILMMLLASATTFGCYYVEAPPPVVVTRPPPLSYDMAWDNALRAANDTGIQVTNADKSSGTIFGERDSAGVNILVTRQHDGRIRVEVNVRGSQAEAGRIADDFYSAYDRYMGRR
jgi:hypothetical protein